MLLFGADDDPWLAPKPFAPRLGEFYLYDEYDPRRAILFNANGTKWACLAFSNSGHDCTNRPPAPAGNQFFLNFDDDDAIARPVVGCGGVRPERHLPPAERDPAERRQRRHVRRPRQRLDGRRDRPRRHLRRLGQRPHERRRRPRERLPGRRQQRRLHELRHHLAQRRAPIPTRSTRIASTAAPASTS